MPYKNKQAQSEFQQRWVMARKLRWLTENGPCQRCGSQWNLEVDHIDPGTKVSHKVWSWSEDRRKEELSKCQVLCSDCHKEKTAQERASKVGPIVHGKKTSYTGRGCRCDLCREASMAYNRAWRQKRTLV